MVDDDVDVAVVIEVAERRAPRDVFGVELRADVVHVEHATAGGPAEVVDSGGRATAQTNRSRARSEAPRIPASSPSAARTIWIFSSGSVSIC